jgi:hypothetical protein
MALAWWGFKGLRQVLHGGRHVGGGQPARHDVLGVGGVHGAIVAGLAVLD